MMTQILLVHILTVNMTTFATDALTIQRLSITVTRQCFALIKAKGLNVNPSLARKGDSCELRLTIIDSKSIDCFVVIITCHYIC